MRISNESALIRFTSGKFSSMSCRFEISLRSKWLIWNPYGLEINFTSIHVKTSKWLTEHQRNVFNRNKISYRFEFISSLMWTHSTYLLLLRVLRITIRTSSLKEVPWNFKQNSLKIPEKKFSKVAGSKKESISK